MTTDCMLPEGRYRARPVRAEYGTTRKGTDLVRVTFQVVDDGAHKDASLIDYWHITAKAAERTLKQLQVCGCDVARGSIQAWLPQFGSVKVVVLTVYHDTHDGQKRARVRYVDSPDMPRPSASLPPITGEQARDFDARWRHLTKQLPMLRDTGSHEDVPF